MWRNNLHVYSFDICARTKGYYWTLVGPWIDYRFDSTRSNGLRHLKDRIIGRLDLRGVLCFKGGSKRRSRESVTNVAPISLTLVYKINLCERWAGASIAPSPTHILRSPNTLSTISAYSITLSATTRLQKPIQPLLNLLGALKYS